MEELSIRKSAIGSASGSIDLLGGFAKEAGSLCIRASSEPKITALVTEISDPTLRISSTKYGRLSMPISEFKDLASGKTEISNFNQWLDTNNSPLWARHILGCLYIYCTDYSWLPYEGISFAIASDIPENQGINSGIALKLACIRALDKLTASFSSYKEIESQLNRAHQYLLQSHFDPSAWIAAATSRPGFLLPVSCSENLAQTPIELPKGVSFFSWTKNEEDTQKSNWYQTNQVAASIGKRIANFESTHPQISTLPTPSLARTLLAPDFPAEISGKEFLEQYGAAKQAYPQFDEGCKYNVRDAFNFSIRENQRCELAIHLLSTMAYKARRQTAEQFGNLLWESHFDCIDSGFETNLTDATIKALLSAGPSEGIYGGRVSYTGSSSTIVALVEKKSIPTLRRIVRETCPDSSVPFQII